MSSESLNPVFRFKNCLQKILRKGAVTYLREQGFSAKEAFTRADF